ncbi:hypothetical protein [Sulfitobacter delicatus]|uniref:Uncharacterized protein n=1 Tax=Sulfitobacter delicatus TaxID=218672 RepID=A0A1G7YKP0_9RHOB|nr:hypothetical protein [Sulfitobacter delicatus]SDG97081.1 hypothetical protein SAMN04489759_1167 [Sulfitobacter delicatus]
MSDEAEQTPTQTAAQPVDWIVLSANILGLSIVVLAAFHANAGGAIQQVARSAGSGAIF